MRKRNVNIVLGAIGLGFAWYSFFILSMSLVARLLSRKETAMLIVLVAGLMLYYWAKENV